MFNKKILILVLFLILLIILFWGIEFFFASRPTTSSPVPSPTGTTPFNLLSKPSFEGEVGIADKLTFVFSKPISSKEIKYSVTPQIELSASIEPGGTVLIFEPIQTWDFNTDYKFTLHKEIRSIDDQILPEDVVIQFKTVSYGGF